jgi:hypothetical protein
MHPPTPAAAVTADADPATPMQLVPLRAPRRGGQRCLPAGRRHAFARRRPKAAGAPSPRALAARRRPWPAEALTRGRTAQRLKQAEAQKEASGARARPATSGARAPFRPP